MSIIPVGMEVKYVNISKIIAGHETVTAGVECCVQETNITRIQRRIAQGTVHYCQ